MHVVSRISKTASRGLRAFFKESSKLGSKWGQLEKVTSINFDVIKQKNRTVERF